MIGGRVLFGGILALELALPGVADAARALKPETAQALDATLSGLEPDIELQGASVDRKTVNVRLCSRGRVACWQIDLSDAREDCGGSVAGPWCVAVRGDARDAALVDRALSALATMDGDALWIGVESDRSDRSRSIVIGLGLTLLLPLLLGIALGCLLGCLRAKHLEQPLVRALIAVAPPTLATGLGLACPSIGLADWVVGGLLVTGGVVAVRRRPGRRACLIAAAIVVGHVVLEAAVRALLPTPPAFPRPSEARLLLASEHVSRLEMSAQRSPWDGRACGLIFGGERPRRISDAASEAPRVLHLGDSMAFGLGVEPGERYLDGVARASRDTVHEEATCPGTSLDFHLLVLRAALREGRYAAVIVHAFSGNDLDELDRPYPCCSQGSLLDWTTEPPSARCESPTTTVSGLGSIKAVVFGSPPPYTLRVATGVSYLARWQCAGWVGASERAMGGPRPGRDETWRRLGAALAGLRDACRTAGARAVLVVVPSRRALTDPGARDARRVHAGIVELGAARGFEVLDLGPVVAGALAELGEAAAFTDQADDDPHFSAAMHRSVAAGLTEFLHERGIAR